LIAVIVIQQNRFDVGQLETELLDISFDVLLSLSKPAPKRI